MTLAIQPEPAAALRASLTWTWPSWPLMVPPETMFARVPRLPAVAEGAVMESDPPVMVTVAVVGAAVAGSANASVNSPALGAV